MRQIYLADGRKVCRECRTPKSIYEYNKCRMRKDGLQYVCQTCDRKRAKQYSQENVTVVLERNEKRRQERFSFLRKYFGDHPCVDCGELDIRVLEFDHVKGNKIAAVSSLISHNRNWGKVLEEIAKCEVRCANCHKKKTHRGTWRDTIT